MAELLTKNSLTQEAFDSLLGALDPERERAGEKYQAIRANLVRFFEWRGAASPEEGADEVINRVAAKLGRGEKFEDLSRYCLGVARMLLREMWKETAASHVAIGELTQVQSVSRDVEERERRLECLRFCLQELGPDGRALILEYYQGERGAKIENRKLMAERLGLTLNTLRMQALRLREKLQRCMKNCLKE